MDSLPRAESPEGVNFLTALLIRFPELGSACLGQGSSHLQLDFYMQEQILEGEFESFRERLELSWEVFFDLQRVEATTTGISRSEARRGEYVGCDADEDAEVDSIQIVRDLDSVTLEELSLIVELVRDAFEDKLATNEEMPDDEAGFQEEMLHRSLERLRNNHGPTADLTGFRDDMRVLIYSSQEEY